MNETLTESSSSNNLLTSTSLRHNNGTQRIVLQKSNITEKTMEDGNKGSFISPQISHKSHTIVSQKSNKRPNHNSLLFSPIKFVSSNVAMTTPVSSQKCSTILSHSTPGGTDAQNKYHPKFTPLQSSGKDKQKFVKMDKNKKETNKRFKMEVWFFN